MLNLLGEYHCRIDAKGRVSFPAKLRKQPDRVLHDGLVVNRDIFEGCLVLYPKPEWDKVNAEMGQLSRYDRQHQLFQRKFMKGATLVELDGSGRMLLPSALLGHYTSTRPTRVFALSRFRAFLRWCTQLLTGTSTTGWARAT